MDAAKSLQSCLTLSDPMDHSLPGSSVHGIFQARVLAWGAIAFSGSKEQVSFNFMAQSPSAMILEPPKIKPLTVSIVSLPICHGMMGLDAMILTF